MEPANENTIPRPKRRHTRKALWLGLFVVLAVVGGRWVWRQVQFTQLRVPLIQAVKAGNAGRVRDLLEQGADPDVRIDYQTEPFTWANVMQMLNGGEPATPSRELTVLIHAAWKNQAEITQLLLEHGANLNLTDFPEQDWNALDYAAGSGNRKCLEALITYGADVNRRGKAGMTPLCRAIFADTQKPPVGENCVGLLVEHGANINIRDDDGQTPLIVAADRGYCAAVRLLLTRGAEVNARDKKGHTALMLAATWREPARMETLLGAGAQIEAQDEDGKTPLWYAVEGAHNAWRGFLTTPDEKERYLTVIQLLLDRKANVQSKDKTGKTLLQVAGTLHETDAIVLLRKATARTSGAGKGAGR